MSVVLVSRKPLFGSPVPLARGTCRQLRTSLRQLRHPLLWPHAVIKTALISLASPLLVAAGAIVSAQLLAVLDHVEEYAPEGPEGTPKLSFLSREVTDDYKQPLYASPAARYWTSSLSRAACQSLDS